MTQFYDLQVTEPTLKGHVVRFVGGTAAVTKDLGKAITVTYISTGLVDLTWSANVEPPGTFAGLAGKPSFQATVPSGIKNFDCAPGVFNTTTRTLRLAIWNASGNLTDLAALQWITLVALFKEDPAL